MSLTDNIPRPRKPKFTPEISFGHMLQAGVMIAAITTSFVMLDAKVGHNEDRLNIHKEKLELLEARLRGVEVSAVRTDERFSNILDLFERIDARLERMEERED